MEACCQEGKKCGSGDIGRLSYIRLRTWPEAGGGQWCSTGSVGFSYYYCAFLLSLHDSSPSLDALTWGLQPPTTLWRTEPPRAEA